METDFIKASRRTYPGNQLGRHTLVSQPGITEHYIAFTFFFKGRNLPSYPANVHPYKAQQRHKGMQDIQARIVRESEYKFWKYTKMAKSVYKRISIKKGKPTPIYFYIGGVQQVDPKKNGDSSPEGRIPQRVTSTPVTTHLQGISSEFKKNLQTTKSRERRTYHATSEASLSRTASTAGPRTTNLAVSRTRTANLGLKAQERFQTLSFQLKCGGCSLWLSQTVANQTVFSLQPWPSQMKERHGNTLS